jgi:gamma-glutamyltranspeptidase/glutathione hydrolase
MDFPGGRLMEVSRRSALGAIVAWPCAAAAAVRGSARFGLHPGPSRPGHSHLNRGYGISTNHPAATEAAHRIRVQGGGVFDMYLAALATAWLVDPADCSPFGRMQGIYRIDGDYGCINAATKVRGEAGSTVPVPGNIPAYFLLRQAGRLHLPLQTILAPARALALEGFQPTDALRFTVMGTADKMGPELKAIYLDDAGQVRPTVRNPHLAELLDVLGRAADENGFWAELYARRPGPWAIAEIQDNAPREGHPRVLRLRDPSGHEYQLRTTANLETWGTWTLLGAAVTAELQASGALSDFARAMEAYLLATILVLDRIPFNVGTLTPKEAMPSADIDIESEGCAIAAHVRKLLDMPKAELWSALHRTYFPGNGSKTDDKNTNQFCIAVNDDFLAFTTSMGPWFGSRRGWFGAGLAYSYAMKSRHLFAGQTHDVTEMSPLIVERDGKPWLAIGAAGSERIFGALTYTLFLKLGLGLPGDMAELIRLPRLFPKDGKVRIHADMPTEVQRHLIDRGFDLDPTKYDLSKHLGIVNLVEEVQPGLFHSGADPSGDGGAF